ncbi:MAG TPA: hypothetical protein VGO43_08840 [Pyrinomonadaceae bacterium]|jgi:hypothetical protein|nr:hypothetical protein [Pyrinomonadaceae bacterium]
MFRANALQMELPLGFRPRTRISLSEVERLIKQHRIEVPCPSRQKLIRMCEDGTFDTPEDPTSRRSFWLVYEDSFWRWAGYATEDDMRQAA